MDTATDDPEVLVSCHQPFLPQRCFSLACRKVRALQGVGAVLAQPHDRLSGCSNSLHCICKILLIKRHSSRHLTGMSR